VGSGQGWSLLLLGILFFFAGFGGLDRGTSKVLREEYGYRCGLEWASMDIWQSVGGVLRRCCGWDFCVCVVGHMFRRIYPEEHTGAFGRKARLYRDHGICEKNTT
jgi:hypothetical protein